MNQTNGGLVTQDLTKNQRKILPVVGFVKKPTIF
jgi:hypothetical protein